VPSVPVNITLNLESPEYTDLKPIGGSMMIAGGIRGIIVYRNSNEQFSAYERTCPYQNHVNCDGIVSLDGNISSASDSCCLSRFSLLDGSPLAGPSGEPLRSYRTEFTNGYLYITN
jgi:nitrite reductase/ring-hydroxylating ferredoxin subunit